MFPVLDSLDGVEPGGPEPADSSNLNDDDEPASIVVPHPRASAPPLEPPASKS